MTLLKSALHLYEVYRAMFEGFERKVVLVDGLDIACAVVRVV